MRTGNIGVLKKARSKRSVPWRRKYGGACYCCTL